MTSTHLNPTALIKNVRGAEGPCVTREGRLMMVEPSAHRVLEVLPDGEARTLAETGGVPAGLQLDGNDDLWVADMQKGILRVTLEGEIHEEVVAFEGAPIRGCNDCYFDGEGNLYFTAPAGSNEQNPCGELFCRRRDGAVLRLDGGFAFCNGLAVSRDDALLIVAETFTKILWGYDIEAPGKVSGKRVWGRLPGDHKGGPDGMDFDAAGNLLVANWGGSSIDVFSPTGALINRLMLPFPSPSNVHFKGPSSKTLLITEHEHNGLWEAEYSDCGQLQYGWK
jgi:gluconolactonase